ncbi:MAG: hypothetical protein NPIRA03_39970 [Nitrospirales bacterium]|nr:MAG: hypothetical protein NPIRA03_39970 [Nitrospirales bacterium]
MGLMFEGKASDDISQPIMVVQVDGDTVTIDTNHPLADIVLNFDTKVLSVREATKQELEHGHTHEHGHDH